VSNYGHLLEPDEVALAKKHIEVLAPKIPALKKRTAVFDLDGTIISDPDTHPGFGVPNQDVVARMRRCLDLGIEVLIHSCRWSDELNPEKDKAQAMAEVEAYLKAHDIPYTALYPPDKAFAVFYCDDKSVHPTDLARLDRLIDESATELKAKKIQAGRQAGWIAPDGTFHAVPSKYTHIGWLIKHGQDLLNEDELAAVLACEGSDSDSVVFAAFDTLFSTGWIRCLGGDSFELERESLPRLKNYLKSNTTSADREDKIYIDFPGEPSLELPLKEVYRLEVEAKLMRPLLFAV